MDNETVLYSVKGSKTFHLDKDCTFLKPNHVNRSAEITSMSVPDDSLGGFKVCAKCSGVKSEGLKPKPMPCPLPPPSEFFKATPPEVIGLRLAKLDVKAGDIVLMNITDPISEDHLHRVEETFEALDIHAVIVCGPGIDVSVIKKDSRLSMRHIIRSLGMLTARVEEIEKIIRKGEGNEILEGHEADVRKADGEAAEGAGGD